MKQIIIFLLVVIVLILAFGQYSTYKRYASPEVNYETETVLNLDNQNPETLKDYYDAVENLNSYVMMQWSANGIDVRTPEDDDAETKIAVDAYSKKISYIKYLEEKLSKPFNDDSSLDTKNFNRINLDSSNKADKSGKAAKIKSLYNPCVKLYNGQKNPLIFEVQKQLVKLGYKVKTDGVYRFETLEAIKSFEEKNDLLIDGYLDALTLEIMFE